MSNTAKREAQKKNREKAIKRAKMMNSLKWVIISIVVLAVVGCVGWAIAYNAVTNTKSNADYSAGLSEDGMIDGVKALDYVDLCDYNNITVTEAEVNPSDEIIETLKTQLLSNFPEHIEDTDYVVADGDNVNIDFRGSVDGVEFEGGSTTEGVGYDLVLGSGAFIPGFEDQVIGHKIGESFDINVTFPENYSAELAGKDAVFAIKINYLIKEATVFDDAFVEKNLSSTALTADAYIASYTKQYRETAISRFVQNYVVENSTVKSYPKKYLKALKGIIKYNDEMEFESQNAIYKNNYGMTMYNSFDEYVTSAKGLSKKEYEASLSTQAMSQADTALIVQAIFEDANLEITSDDITSALAETGYSSDYYESYVATYGKGRLNQSAMYYSVIRFLDTVVNVVE